MVLCHQDHLIEYKPFVESFQLRKIFSIMMELVSVFRLSATLQMKVFLIEAMFLHLTKVGQIQAEKFKHTCYLHLARLFRFDEKM